MGKITKQKEQQEDLELGFTQKELNLYIDGKNSFKSEEDFLTSVGAIYLDKLNHWVVIYNEDNISKACPYTGIKYNTPLIFNFYRRIDFEASKIERRREFAKEKSLQAYDKPEYAPNHNAYNRE